MKSFFCVGQTVIERCTRNLCTITAIYPNGKLVLDNFLVLDPEFVQEQEEYLDPTNYFYHHSIFGEAVQQINDHFNDFLYWIHEKENEMIHVVIRGIDNRIHLAQSQLEKWLLIKRTAEYNLNQWSSGEFNRVVSYHMPFLNPENCTDYIKN